MTTEERVKIIICENLTPWHVVRTSAELKPEHKLIDDLGADSLDLVELVMDFEEKFDHEISDESAGKCLTVGDCLDYANDNFGA